MEVWKEKLWRDWQNGRIRRTGNRSLITGVRQCGKTYVIKEFGNRYFEDVAYFYFEGNKGLASIFDYDLEPERIIKELGSIVRGKEITPGKTLVILMKFRHARKQLPR